jgi:HPt (histidine-containing phosphotransfer) domain-containing protein
MNDHVAKPIQRESLLDAVETWMSEPPLTTARADVGENLAFMTLDKQVYSDISTLMGDQGTDRLLSRLEEQLQGLSTETESDRFKIAAHAHKLVASAGMLGFMRLSQLCAELENACIENGDIDELLTRVDEARMLALREVSDLRRAA